MADGGRERELKLRVADAAALNAIRREANGTDLGTVDQTNHFFDTPEGALRRAKYIVRLRDESGRFFLTAKGPGSKTAEAALSSKAETEREIPGTLAERILSGADSPMIAFGEGAALTDPERPLIDAVAELTSSRLWVRVGAFHNQRTRIRAQLPDAEGGVEVMLELDRTTFPGDLRHFEVEVELSLADDPARVDSALRALLARAGVEGRPAPGKSKRFFAALKL